MASAIVNIMLAVLVPTSILSIIFAPWISQIYRCASAIPGEVQQQTVVLMRIMLVSPAIFGVSGIVMGILNAHQHFLLPAIAPIMYNLGLIIGGIVGGSTDLGVMGPTIGVVVGASLGHLLIQIPGLVRLSGEVYLYHWQARSCSS